ncbi:non-hydrolyzing UDP-N-acetylglucosamine 2-epimerase [Natronolimnobius baerhuensis]|uniref:UDP-N-acetylglucosamine 2-epimerase (Non-hydrolyzing) n=1 Tax=Natronolimnobius baerhuensis TaxID=253108 RepID=A0A202E750_9EURY|nr:UDP-N-acetylglucosamine 2-epimerase (non-hydrolyzing) [Natronolimnobius baerhuensis]OVE84087.1 UDP-N-acetylglucosamine 2-epimerase (non-hydrolyzing) [Natronolimnobius baerhuensis]
MKLVSVVGARPQFVKAFAVSRHLRPDHEEILVHTGQHYSDDLSAVFFDELSIPDPDYNLGVGSDTHGRQTAAMIEGIEEILLEESPDIVLLYGDTNSTLAGAIAASKLDDPIAHVEAGLRSHDRSMPEEINRVLTDHVSDLLFAPSDLAKTMLEGEGITDGVHVVGDVGYDAIRWARERAADRSEILEQSALEEDNYVLGTIHRPKNTETPSRLTTIIDALVAAPQRVVVPLHPRTEAPLREYGLWEAANRGLEIIDPVGYLDFVHLLEGAERVVTDSGGVQKEAFYLETPCITLREETEWQETVDCGWNRLVGADQEALTAALETDSWPTSTPSLYGDGRAAEKIITILENDDRD